MLGPSIIVGSHDSWATVVLDGAGGVQTLQSSPYKGDPRMREMHGGVSNTQGGEITGSISPGKRHRLLLAWLMLEANFVQQDKRFRTFCRSLDHSDIKVSNKSALALVVASKQKVENVGLRAWVGLETLCPSVSRAALMPCPAPSYSLATLSSLSFIVLITSAFQDSVKNSFKKKLCGSLSAVTANVSPYGYKKFCLEEKKKQKPESQIPPVTIFFCFPSSCLEYFIFLLFSDFSTFPLEQREIGEKSCSVRSRR